MQSDSRTISFPTLATVAVLTVVAGLVGFVAVTTWGRVFEGQPRDTLFAAGMAGWVWLVFVAGIPVFAVFESRGLLPAVKVHFALVGIRLVTSLALAAALVKFGQGTAEIIFLTLVSLYLPLLTVDSWFAARHLLKSTLQTPTNANHATQATQAS